MSVLVLLGAHALTLLLGCSRNSVLLMYVLFLLLWRLTRETKKGEIVPVYETATTISTATINNSKVVPGTW